MVGLIYLGLTGTGLIVGLITALVFLSRPRFSRRAVRPLAVFVFASGLGWCFGFFGRDPGGSATGVALWIAFLLVVLGLAVISATSMRSGWGAVLAGAMLAGMFIAGMWGDYLAHAWGWNGERLGGSEDITPQGKMVIGIIFLSPAVFGIGFIVGAISRAVLFRKPTPSA